MSMVDASVAAVAAGGSPPAGAVRRVESISPSRAADFLSCPLRYRFRSIDRLPEPPNLEATRGTVVHAALERLFDLPAAARSVERAQALVEPAWQAVLAAEPELAALFPDAAGLDGWLGSARELVRAYFNLEDPTRIEPVAREALVETTLPSGLRLRGYLDRLDEAANGALRVVDYKTGKAPPPPFEARALFQMKFYALLLWRSRGVVPAMLQLVYLADQQVLRYVPEQLELAATERKLEAVSAAIEASFDRGEFRANPSRLCDWCAHQALCPAFGGTPPPLPERPVPAPPRP